MKLLKLHRRGNSTLRKCLPIILTIFVSSCPERSVSQKLDSLERRMEFAQGIEVCGILYGIGYELVDVEYGQALRYAKNSIACAKKYNDTLQVVRGIHLQAMAFRRLGEIDSSNAVIISILPVVRQKRYERELQDLLHGLALGLLLKAQFDESLKYNFEALEIRRKLATPFQVGSTLFNIGFVYYKLGDYTKALDYYAQALTQLEIDPRDGRLTEKLLVNSALAHAYLGNLGQAAEHLTEAVNKCNDNCLPDEQENIAFCSGIISLTQGDSLEAKNHFLNSYLLAKSNRHERLQLDNIIYLSRISLGLEAIHEAEQYLILAEKLILVGVPYDMELMKVYAEFANLYDRKGDYRKVADFQRRYMALKDSIYDDEVTTQLMRIEADHVEKEKNASIEAQRERLKLNDKIIFRQRIATTFAGTTVALLAGFVALLIRSVKEKKQRNEDLEVRVKNRTKELEALVNQSQGLYTEKKMWFDKILSAVRNTTKTVAGLTLLASRDAELNEQYIKLIEQEMNRLLMHVNSYVSRSNAGIKEYKDEV